MTSERQQKFLDWLVQKGVIKPEQAAPILQEAASLNKNLEQVLMDKHLLEEEQLVKAKAGTLKERLRDFGILKFTFANRRARIKQLHVCENQ